MSKLFIHSFESKHGLIRLAATEVGLAIVSLPGKSERQFNKEIKKRYSNYTINNSNPILKQTEKQLNLYFEGRLDKFTLKLDVEGTPFQKKVLKAVSSIPFGKTKTYGQIAKAVKNPKAFRAVGSVNANNKIPFVIPCHRVVAANGLGGYAGGLALKIKLLKLENNIKQ